MSKSCAVHFTNASIDVLIRLKTTAALIGAVGEQEVYVYGEFHDISVLKPALETNGVKASWIYDFSSEFITGVAGCLDFIFKKAREPGFRLVQHGLPIQFLKKGVCSKRRLAVCMSTSKSDMYPPLIHSKITCTRIYWKEIEGKGVLYTLMLETPKTQFELDKSIVEIDGWLRKSIGEGFISVGEMFGCKVRTFDNTHDPFLLKHVFDGDAVRPDIKAWTPPSASIERWKNHVYKTISKVYCAGRLNELIQMETTGLKRGMVFVIVSESSQYPMIGATKRSDFLLLFRELSKFLSEPLKPIYTVTSNHPFQLEAKIHKHFEAFRISEAGTLTEFVNIDVKRIGAYLQANFNTRNAPI